MNQRFVTPAAHPEIAIRVLGVGFANADCVLPPRAHALLSDREKNLAGVDASTWHMRVAYEGCYRVHALVSISSPDQWSPSQF